MDDYLQSYKANCKNCYKCIRYCPVKSIRFSENQAHIVTEECILCGKCYVVCPQNVKIIRNDIHVVKSLMATGRPVYASVAPSFIANYKGCTIASMQKALKQAGFFSVQETAVGATYVKHYYEKLVKEAKQKIIITSSCHTVNLLIQKFYPEALPYLAPIISPMQAHSLSIKKEHPDAFTVFIGPCISKKEEAARYGGLVDCVLTFHELDEWLSEEEIRFQACEDLALKGRTRIFPTAGGVLRSMYCDSSDYRYLHIDGIENCISALQEIIEGNMTKCFVEMSACTGSCIGGPAIDRASRTSVRGLLTVEAYMGADDFPIIPGADSEFKKNIPYMGLPHRQKPGSRTIEEILKKMGKEVPEQELNCGSCGYNTCREKALAVYLGNADLTMCLPFLKEKAESFSDHIIKNSPDGIIVLNEDLKVYQVNASAMRILQVENMKDAIGAYVGRFLDPTIYLSIMASEEAIHNRKLDLQRFQKIVTETVIYDKNYHIIISIMRDITEKEIHRTKKEEVTKHSLEIADKVIEKQMRVVQEIASLLGETAAETKIALTKLKETLRNE